MIYHRRALSDFFIGLFKTDSRHRNPSGPQVVAEGVYPPANAANFFRIPVELVELILDCCDPHTLRSSSLVCKYWRASTVHRLFSKVDLPPTASPAFVEFLQSKSGEPVRRFIQSLALTTEFGSGQKSLVRAIRGLSALLQPSSLRLTIYDNAELARAHGFRSRPAPRKDLRVFQNSFKTVTTLELTLFSNTFIEVAEIISSLPILETLIISGGTGTKQIEWEFPSKNRSLPCTVHTIRLPTVDNSSAFLHWLHSHNQPQIQTLVLGGISLFQLANSYLRKLGATLHCLTITGLVFHQDRDPRFTADLSYNTNLRTLAILKGRRSSADVFRTLTRVSSYSMEELEFDVWNPTDDPIGRTGRYWPRLDALLASSQFSELRRVVINVDLKQRRKVEVQLPITNSRKMLHFRSLQSSKI